MPEQRVFIYRRTGNLGDAIQTYALCRLLGQPCLGIYRDEPFPEQGKELVLIANGWLGRAPPQRPGPAVFAGIHLGCNEPGYMRWIADSGEIAGSRDSYSLALMQCNGIRSAFVGCATLTLERFRGLRSGRYSIDVGPYDGTSFLTNEIDDDLTWPQQWQAASERLELLRRAELVYSNRLHVILPCLAFGTPVVFPLRDLPSVVDKHRLTLLNELPFDYNEPVVADVSGVAEGYVKFLSDRVDPRPCSAEPPMPVAASSACATQP